MHKALNSLGVVAAIVIALYAVNLVPEQPAVGGTGPEQTQHQYFLAGSTEGGPTYATSSAGTVTYTDTAFFNGVTQEKTSLVEHTATGAVTASLPASSTLGSFVPDAGDSASVYVQALQNGVTLSGNTGVTVNFAPNASSTIAAGDVARLDFVRATTTDIEVLVTN